ncbi:hypothetical protein CVD28_22595 [Bacillus sp. M6-12]|uniref:YisL family protein n=1 Tax=Bacillus sp. M6-12 TaxID=2054166 RepID=UPI000C786828|nr:YisL family protein [Bacillus sp. M6-12]PLS15505.1 hypothetical protein CVD28_22595 [Bacillus sp. M6-12]
MTHAHITTWLIALILFFVAFSMQKSGKQKAAKINHMILRVFYLLIIATGGMMIKSMYGPYIVKALIGIIVIGLMEMVLVRSAKGKDTKVLWIVFAVAFIVVVYMGLSLPLGFKPFA